MSASPPLPRRVVGAVRRGLVGAVNRLGWVFARTDDYYSPLRPLAELERNVRRWHRPSRMAGIAYDLAAIETTLRELVAAFGAEYGAMPPYEELKRQRRGPGFTIVDAMVLYMMLRRQKPRHYLEVGSGLSTFFASLALERNAVEGHPATLTVVDPFVSDITRTIPGIEVVAAEAQDVPVERYTALGEGDVLFIDSTHIVRIDGEVPYLVLEVLPALAAGVLVHVHDVHFPYNVPIDPDAYLFARRWPMPFDEAMLVQAYLAHNARASIVMSTPLLRHFREPVLAEVLPDYRRLDPADFDTHHGSLWFLTRPAP